MSNTPLSQSDFSKPTIFVSFLGCHNLFLTLFKRHTSFATLTSSSYLLPIEKVNKSLGFMYLLILDNKYLESLPPDKLSRILSFFLKIFVKTDLLVFSSSLDASLISLIFFFF